LINSLLFFLKYGLYALILSIALNSMSKQFELGLSYGKVFMICFYGMSLGMLLTNFNIAMNLISPMLVSMVTMFVSIHFMTTAIVLMRKDNQVWYFGMWHCAHITVVVTLIICNLSDDKIWEVIFICLLFSMEFNLSHNKSLK